MNDLVARRFSGYRQPKTLLGCADLQLPPDPGPERQQPLGNPHHNPSRGTPAVIFQSSSFRSAKADTLPPAAMIAAGKGCEVRISAPAIYELAARC